MAIKRASRDRACVGKRRSPGWRRPIILVATLALVGSACTGRGATSTPTANAEPPPQSPAEEMEGLLATVRIPAFNPLDWHVWLGLVDRVVARTAADEPTFSVGGVETFYTPDGRPIRASLRYVNDVVAMWVETGVHVNRTALAGAADVFAEEVYTVRVFFGEEWTPGVDNDPRPAVLHLAALPDSVGLFRLSDEFPASVYPTSNQRELLFVSPGPQSQTRVAVRRLRPFDTNPTRGFSGRHHDVHACGSAASTRRVS